MSEIIAFIQGLLCKPNLCDEERYHLQFLLNLCQKLRQNPTLITASKFNLTSIPLTQNGYDSLFVVSDCESDNPNLWQKVRQNGEVIELQSGDMLIQFK